MYTPSTDLRLNTPLADLDRFLESTLVTTPRGAVARALCAAIGAALGACALLMVGTGPRLPIDLFFAPVLAACFFFRRRGLWALVPALILFHLASRTMNHIPLSGLLVRDLLELIEWLVLAAFVLVTLDKYTAVKKHEARIVRDIGLARTLQTALAPPDYDFGRVRLCGVIRQSQDIGGDFYYFRPFQEKYVVFCLGDTMGKGMSASMVMAIIMGFFFEWGKRSPSPSIVLGKLNRRLLRLWGDETTWFATLFYAVFDEEQGVLTFASGGHQDAVLLRASGEIEMLSAEGIPIGIFEDSVWAEKQCRLQEGDRVLLFTDGVTEARCADGRLFSSERVLEVIRSEPVTSSAELLNRLELAVMEHTNGILTDDVAMLVMEVKPGASFEATPSVRPVTDA